jgi:hypothetical protein
VGLRVREAVIKGFKRAGNLVMSLDGLAKDPHTAILLDGKSGALTHEDVSVQAGNVLFQTIHTFQGSEKVFFQGLQGDGINIGKLGVDIR